VSRIEQSGRMSLRRPKLPFKRGSAPEEEEEEEEDLGFLLQVHNIINLFMMKK